MKPEEKATQHLIIGLTTDGEHHKQFELEEAFRALCGKEYFERIKREIQWEDGIPD